MRQRQGDACTSTKGKPASSRPATSTHRHRPRTPDRRAAQGSGATVHCTECDPCRTVLSALGAIRSHAAAARLAHAAAAPPDERVGTHTRLEALAVDDRWARLVVLLLGDPHLLEGRDHRASRAADPHAVLALRWRN